MQTNSPQVKWNLLLLSPEKNDPFVLPGWQLPKEEARAPPMHYDNYYIYIEVSWQVREFWFPLFCSLSLFFGCFLSLSSNDIANSEKKKKKKVREFW